MNSLNNGFGSFEVRGSDIENDVRLFHLLLARKWTVVITSVLFSFAGVLFALAQAPVYSAKAVVQLETRNSGLQLSNDIATILEPESEVGTELEIIKSRLVLDKVVERLQLDVIAEPKYFPYINNLSAHFDLPKPAWDFFRGHAWDGDSITVERLELPADWYGKRFDITKLSDSDFTILTPVGVALRGQINKTLEDEESGLSILVSQLIGDTETQYIVRKVRPLVAVNTLRSKLSVTEKTRKTGIISILVEDREASSAEAVVAAIVDGYVEQNIGRSAEEADRSLLFLNEQIPLIQEELTIAEGELNAYRLENSSIDLNFEAQSILERSVALDAQLSGLSLEETELSRRYTPNHPAYRALLDKKQRLADEKSRLLVSVKSLPETQQEVLRRTRDVDVSQQIYLQLLNKSQELSVMKAGAVGNVRLIDEAAANPSPVAPKVPITAATAAILGLLAAVSTILLGAMKTKEIVGPDDLAGLGIPALGTVPFSSIEAKLSKRLSHSILSLERPTEIAVESMRNLRTNIFFTLPDRERNVVCITGPSPTVGKTFICINLAYLAAQVGVRVLIIDADMRKGKVGKYFNVSQNLPGLAQLLSGMSTREQVLQKVSIENANVRNPALRLMKNTTLAGKILETAGKSEPDIDLVGWRSPSGSTPVDIAKKTAITEITVVSRGQAPHNPAELLMGERFPSFLEWASANFDMVFVDTPPVLAATDAQIVGRYADFNLMVLRQCETTKHEAEEVVRNFTNSKSQVNGFVINAYDANGNKYGKYGPQYGYRYSY